LYIDFTDHDTNDLYKRQKDKGEKNHLSQLSVDKLAIFPKQFHKGLPGDGCVGRNM
jgi:hypothetical protein